MFFKNSQSARKNPFDAIFQKVEFQDVIKNKSCVPDFPYIVDIELTNHCNLKCIFCGQQAMNRKKGFLKDEILKKVIDECAIYNTPIRFIRWGEPFLHEKIIVFFKYIKSKNLLLHVTNNGLVISQKHMEALIDLEINSLIFSFQGGTKEQYEIMRNNTLYHVLKNNVLKMVELRGDKNKPYIHISTTITDETKDQIDSFVNYWGNIVDSVGVGHTNLSRLTSNQINSFEARNKIELLKKHETVKKIYRPCTEVYQKLSIDWDGKVTCCCGDYDNFMTIGDIEESSLYNIWNNSNELKMFRELLNKNYHRSLALCSTCYHAYEEY